MERLKKDLRRWVKEKWTNKKGQSGKGSGKTGWRPTVKVSSKTPETWSEMTPAEKRKKTENKKKANKKGGGWSTHLKGRKQVWNVKKNEQYDMYANFTPSTNYDMTTDFPINKDYNMYFDDYSECGSDHIHVGPLVIEICHHENGSHVCVYDENTGLKVAETEISNHDVSDHMESIKEGMADILKNRESCFVEIKKSEKPFHGYNKKRNSITGGLSDSYRKKYNRETGSNLKRPVTGKVKPGSKAAKRRKSFCARMSGMPGATSKDGKLTRKGAALKRWKCNKSENIKKSEKLKNFIQKVEQKRQLEHYSPHQNLKEINPKFKGTGVDSMTNRAYTEHPHSFYYIAGTEPEHIVTQKAKQKYTVELPNEAKIYDIANDHEKFYEQVLNENNQAFNRDMLLGKIKNAGYHGFTHTKSALPNVVALFHAMPVKENK